MIFKNFAQFSLFMHPDQAQNTLSGIQGQAATAIAVIYVTGPTVLDKSKVLCTLAPPHPAPLLVCAT